MEVQLSQIDDNTLRVVLDRSRKDHKATIKAEGDEANKMQTKEQTDLNKVSSGVAPIEDEPKDKKKEKESEVMLTKDQSVNGNTPATTNDPLASLRAMRAEFSKDESKKDFVKTLDAQIEAIESQMTVKKDEYAKQLSEAVELVNSLKGTVEDLKTANEAQKTEYDKQGAKMDVLLDSERTQKRAAKFESVVAKLKGIAWPGQIEVLQKYALLPEAEKQVFKFSKTLEDGTVEESTASAFEFGVELLLAIPEGARSGKLEEEVTPAKAIPADQDMDRVDAKIAAFEIGKKIQGVHGSDLKTAVDERRALIVAPGQ